MYNLLHPCERHSLVYLMPGVSMSYLDNQYNQVRTILSPLVYDLEFVIIH